MENLGFLIFIIVMFLLQSLGRVLTKRRQEIPRPQEEKPAKQKTLEDILRTMGFPPMEEPPVEEEPVEIVIEEEKPKIIKEEVVKQKPEEEKLVPALKKISSEIDVLPFDRLEEAIIYSTIIGPPKALQSRRGVGIGIRSSLKNW